MTPERCAEIHATCFTTPRPWGAAEFASLLESDTCFLCEDPNGFALGRSAGPETELLTVAVVPEAQGNGTGRLLLRAFERTAVERGARDLFLEVANGNQAAIYLYETSGYTQCGLRRDYYQSPKGPTVSALVYTKPLE